MQLLQSLQDEELVDNIRSKSKRKFELVLRSVSVAEDNIEINKINKTSLENKFIWIIFSYKKLFNLYEKKIKSVKKKIIFSLDDFQLVFFRFFSPHY